MNFDAQYKSKIISIDNYTINSKKSLFANGTGYNIIIEGCFIAF